MSFVHLHCHSEYSLLDGANRIDDLIARALELEQPALAITDHGNLHGAWEFQEKARKAGLKPIVGMEAYVAPGDRRARARPAPGAKPYYHLVLLAQNAAGYRNLVKLSSLAYTEGFYVKPRIDRELLARYSEGLVVSSACMAGEVASHLLANDYEAAKSAASWYANLFPDRYYLEVQAHDSQGQSRLNERIFALGTDLGLPVIATNDAHFLRSGDHDAHDVLLCIGLGKDRTESDRMRYDAGLYFKSAPEMAERFPDRADVLENTLRIAEESGIELKKSYQVPSFPLPDGVATENELLVRLSEAGARERYGDPLPQNVRERLDYEVGVITKTGYAGYFLIVADFIAAARERGIPVGPGRGSAAGSLVAYALRITDVCPLRFDLLFERFLNPERVSMPDIDVDFCFERRGEVIEYVRQKYGRESVGQIITFGTMKSRAVIKDVGRVLGFSPSETDQLAKLIPNMPNFSLTVKEATRKVPEVAQLYRNDDRYRQLLDYAMALEGLSRHAGVHAAGVVIAPGPIDEYVPVCTQSSRGSGGDADENIVVTQYDMNALEKAGMLKMDFLGLTTLSIISQCCKTIRETHGKEIIWSEIPLDDAKTYEIFAQGRTDAVFQFESSGMQEICRKLRPKSIEDLSALNALYRPGPLDGGMVDDFIDRYHGRKPIEYLTSEMDEILNNTYGVCVYQEQIMQLAQKLGGYSLGEADLMRRAMGKKKREEMAVHEEKFIAGCVKNKIIKKKAKEIFRLMAQFADYGFNKSHSVAYAHVAYQTAYLKAHYLEHFYAAVMTYQADDAAKIFKYASELRAQGIRMLPPDVNESGPGFTPVEGAIRFGLAAIKGIGQTAVAPIIEARQEKPFTSIFDFAERVGEKGTGKRVLESLVAAGAFDSLKNAGEDLHQWRASLHATVDKALASGASRRRERESGQFDMFGSLAAGGNDGAAAEMYRPLEKATPWTHRELLVHEKATVGFYVSGHPLEDHAERIEELNCMTVADLAACGPDARVRLAGVVSDFNVRNTKKGDRYAMFRLEDVSGVSVKCVLWPEAFKTKGQDAANDAVILAAGRLDGGGDTSQTVVCDEVVLLEKAKIPSHATWTRPGTGRAPAQAIAITLPAGDDLAKVSEAVVGALIAHPGDCEVFIDLPLEEEGFTVRAKAAGFIKVRPTQRLRDDLTAAGVRFEMIDTKPAV